MSSQEPEKISGIESTQGSKKVESTSEVESTERSSPNKEKFDQLTSKPAEPTQQVQNENIGKPSPMQNVQPVEPSSRPSKAEIVQKTDAMVHRIDDIKKELSTAGQVNPAYHNVLQSKLSHINESVKIALSKVGVEGAAMKPPASVTGNGAIDKFLGMLTHGQSEMTKLSSSMSGDASGSFSPGQLLAVQIKVNHMQQEIEFFTSALSKALESVKTIMNVQV
jgi:hypothetical protein